MSPVTHMVSFKLKNDSGEAAQELYDKFLALQTSCVRESDGQQYVINLRGGKQVGPTGLAKDMQYCYLMDFATAEDCDYYLNDDPVHGAFKRYCFEVCDDLISLDFVAGEL